MAGKRDDEAISEENRRINEGLGAARSPGPGATPPEQRSSPRSMNMTSRKCDPFVSSPLEDLDLHRQRSAELAGTGDLSQPPVARRVPRM